MQLISKPLGSLYKAITLFKAGGGGGKDHQMVILKVIFLFFFVSKRKGEGGERLLHNYKSAEIVTQEKTFQIKRIPEKNIWQRLALVFPNNH